jgi:hypothetical protein
VGPTAPAHSFVMAAMQPRRPRAARMSELRARSSEYLVPCPFAGSLHCTWEGRGGRYLAGHALCDAEHVRAVEAAGGFGESTVSYPTAEDAMDALQDLSLPCGYSWHQDSTTTRADDDMPRRLLRCACAWRPFAGSGTQAGAAAQSLQRQALANFCAGCPASPQCACCAGEGAPWGTGGGRGKCEETPPARAEYSNRVGFLALSSISSTPVRPPLALSDTPLATTTRSWPLVDICAHF